jgi:N6-adenosine-specific RNA methylase IME4
VATVKYRTIVADPPWPIGDFPAWFKTSRQSPKEKTLGYNPTPYPTMSVDEIKRLPVTELSLADAGGKQSGPREGSLLFLWTTTHFLCAAHDVARAWRFVPTMVLVWCKKPDGVFGGPFHSNVEFVVVGRRGAPRFVGTSQTRWFTWPRGTHSQKPEAFYDLVEQVSPGPYLELFARRNRLGWDTWGNEALNHVELSG